MARAHVIELAVPAVVGTVVAAGILVGTDAGPTALALGVAASAALWARHRAPLATLAVSTGLVLALFAVDRSAGSAAVFAPAVALYSVALTRSRLEQLAATIAAVVVVVGVDVVLRADHTVTAGTLMHIALVAVPLLAAEALRSHRANLALLVERLELAERTREEEAQRRAEQERIRIARDLHDVVAHTLTTINVQSGVAAHLLDREPRHAHTALTLIEDASREALAELRAILGVLRDDDQAPLEPAPTVEAVEQLVERARTAGLDVRLDVAGQRPERLPDAVQVATFRIVQESLTNATRHAPGTPARVRLAFESDRLVVGVKSGPGEPANGHGIGVGIMGMKERAATVGGSLRAGPVLDGFHVDAELPYHRAE
jgi:signal transduction histidine kinase